MQANATVTRQHGWEYREGDAITGTYHGTPFSGIVTAERAHTMYHRCTMIFVALSEPLQVALLPTPEPRTTLLLYVND